MLITLFKRLNLVTGPLAKNTSHSGLDVIKKSLFGQKQFSGGETFLTFGNACHERFLVDSYKRVVTKEEGARLVKIVDNLAKHPIVKALTANSIKEQKFYVVLNGVELAMILDIKQPKKATGADLKTTASKTYEEFVASAVDYNYFRQGETYKIGAKLKHFFFIAVMKEEPHNVYVLNVADFPDEIAYAQEELAFLLYFYKHYGKTVIPIAV